MPMSSQQHEVDEIVASLEAKKLEDEEHVDVKPKKKERGVSLLLGKKPKYKTSSKKNESKVVPLANSEMIDGGEGVGGMNPLLAAVTVPMVVTEKKPEPEPQLR